MKWKYKKILSALMILLVSCSAVSSVTANAEKHYIIEDEPLCSLVYDGGYNYFNGKLAETREEIEELERDVIETGDYVLANESGHELTDTAFKTLLESCRDEDGQKNFSFEKYLNPQNTFHNTYSKVYLYKPAFERYMEALENDTLNDNPFISFELEYSTVIISYEIQFFHDRIGADLSYETDDGIPEWYQTGYLKVISPANVEITLFLTEEQNYYSFYVPKEEPFYIKLKQGGYNVIQVNSQNTGDGEETLPYNDLIQITPDNETKENAYLLQLQAFAEKYNIQDLPAETQTIIETRNIYEDPFAEKTTIETEESDVPVLEQNPALFWAVCGLCGTALIVLAIISLKQKNRYPNEKGDNYEKP